MNASNRNLLAVALATVLLPSAAWAEKGVATTAAQTVQSSTQNEPQRTVRDIHKPVTQTTEHVEQTTMPPPSPPTSQGAEHAATHSSVVQRELWGRLDTNGDGRISATEGAVDSSFKSDFATMDADRDGFVSDSEYRIAAKEEHDATRTMGDAEAASDSMAGMRDTIVRLDSNADGSISASEGEADATFRTNFAAIDSNSDGMVTDAEYRAWVKAQRK